MKRWFLLIVLLLAGCAPSAPSTNIQTGATPFIAESYPTSAAKGVSPGQAASGVDVSVTRAWQDGKQVNADVCFSVPDDSDWAIYKASLQYGDTTLTDFGTTLVSRQSPANGQPGQRCDTVNFYVPPDAVLSNVTISIDSLAAIPREGE